MDSRETRTPWRKRVFEIIEVSADSDHAGRLYDMVNTLSIVVNLAVSILYTFESVRTACGSLLLTIESATVIFFAADCALRILTAKYLYPKLPEPKAILKYLTSFTGVVDVLSFLPYFLPVFFPAGAAAFRMFRVVRILRLFRINAYYDSLNVIAEVISSKKQQLFSSVFIIVVLLLASSLCMYSLEHEAQPDVFTNAFSGIWWAVSTLLTVGYGDIYPITPLGKAFSIVITFLGVGMVAIPTGIISAGFVDQYSRIKRISDYANEEDIQFIKIRLVDSDPWCGMSISDVGLPRGVIIAVIQRGKKTVVPRGDVTLLPGDTLVLAAESVDDDQHIELKEVVLRSHHDWVGTAIRDLDISRKTIIIMVKRQNRVLIPNGSMVLEEGDRVILYSQTRVTDATEIQI